MKLLIVEDEPKVAAFLTEGLRSSGYEVDIAYDGELAKRMVFKTEYDVVLLDIIIPHINGYELCKLIKQQQPQTPVLLLTALGTTDDKLMGFDMGADDYLVKPFEFKELLARIRVLARRHSGAIQTRHVLKIADLELDLNEKVARRSGKEITLTAKEFLLLEYFMNNQGRVLSRVNIAEKVWEHTFDTGTNVVDVYVNLLRNKIDKDFDTKLFHTKVGMGYMLKEK